MQKGFSLVELSIVLVILGLLTGGILAGQNLIRASELRSVVSELRNFQSATMTFRDKYFALPGDMRNATDFWGVLAGDGLNAACQDTAATGADTCNGNGDGVIYTSVVGFDERLRVWQHLANAGLIEGSYTGKTDGASGSIEQVAGENSPRSKMGQGFWDMLTHSVPSTDPSHFESPTALVAHLRHDDGTNQAKAPLIPEELWNIDTKLDDGRPGSGSVKTHKNSSAAAPDCATTDDPADAEYDLQNTSVKCHARFKMF